MGFRRILPFLGVLIGLPDWIRFYMGQWSVQAVQLRLLKRILLKNSLTLWGKKHHFSNIRTYQHFTNVPPSNYEDYTESIMRIKCDEQEILSKSSIMQLLPTSGTTRANKLIPCNSDMLHEFRRSINVWLINLCIRCPALFSGKQYWALSPTTPFTHDDSSTIPIGFADDTRYLGTLQSRLFAHTFAVPYILKSITDRSAHAYLTLLFLLRERNLRFIFIWSPTFIIAKLEMLTLWKFQLLHDIEAGSITEEISLSAKQRKQFTHLLNADPERAAELAAIDIANRENWRSLWPNLKMISCWADGASAHFCNQLAALFPDVTIEQKGLLATEAVVTIPWWRGNCKPVAYRSHFFEFREVATGQIRPLWKITPGKQYTVLVTTGGGLYRYDLHDIVEVNGFIGKIPCLTFIGRDNATVDMVGEKVTEAQLQQFIHEKALARAFVIAAPVARENLLTYTLFLEPHENSSIDEISLVTAFEQCLSLNYHYHHARMSGQLSHAKLYLVSPGTGLSSFIRHEEECGRRAGDIKYRYLDSKTDWDTVFPGRYASIGTI